MTYRQCPHGLHHPPGPHSCDGCWCEGERDHALYGWDHDTAPSGTPTGCDRCDDQNVPLPSTLPSDELHRAAHDLWRALTEPFVRLLERITR